MKKNKILIFVSLVNMFHATVPSTFKAKANPNHHTDPYYGAPEGDKSFKHGTTTQEKPGPLNFNFKPARGYIGASPGEIMKTIFKHPNLKDKFTQAWNHNKADSEQKSANDLETAFRSGKMEYAHLREIIGSDRSEENHRLLLVLEEALIKLHQEYAYIYTTSANNYFSKLVFTGIRNPWSLWEDTEQMKQITAEIDKLADLAKPHYPATAARMKARVTALRNWRKLVALEASSAAIAAYSGYKKITGAWNQMTSGSSK